MKTIPNLYAKLSAARKATWISYALLLLILVCNGLYRHYSWPMTALTVVPLLIFIPGMRKERYKSLSLLCFVTLFYFVATVNNLFASNRSGFDIVELLLVIALYTASMMFSRWKQYSLYQPDDVTAQGTSLQPQPTQEDN